MDEVDETPQSGESSEDEPFWAEAVPFPLGLVRRLNALTAEVGAVDPAAPTIGPVMLGESGTH